MVGLSAFVGLALTPWIVRNYQLTGDSCRPARTAASSCGTARCRSARISKAAPTTRDRSSSGVVRLHQPRRRLARRSPARRGLRRLSDRRRDRFWTDRDGTRRRVTMTAAGGDDLTGELPGQPDPTSIYYSLEAIGRPRDGERGTAPTPLDGEGIRPCTGLVGAFERSGSARRLLDVFDLARMRGVAWRDGAFPGRLDLDRNGADR